MIPSEKIPFNLKFSPITEAEIAKQTIELDAQDERSEKEIAQESISPEDIATLGLLLTKATSKTKE